jgi:hypothetical protein
VLPGGVGPPAVEPSVPPRSATKFHEEQPNRSEPRQEASTGQNMTKQSTAMFADTVTPTSSFNLRGSGVRLDFQLK